MNTFKDLILPGVILASLVFLTGLLVRLFLSDEYLFLLIPLASLITYQFISRNKKLKNKGPLYGSIISLVSMIIIGILAYLTNTTLFGIPFRSLNMMLFVGGLLGGIIAQYNILFTHKVK